MPADRKSLEVAPHDPREDLVPFVGEDPEDEEPVSSADPAVLVAVAMLRRALAAALPCPAACSVHVVQAPSPVWTEALAEAWSAMIDSATASPRSKGSEWWRRGQWVSFIRMEAPSGRADPANEGVAKALAKHRLLVGFAHDPALLPQDLTDAADWHVSVLAPSAEEVMKGAPDCEPEFGYVALTDEEAAGMTPRMLRLAVRPDQTTEEWIAKLRDLLGRERGAGKAALAPRDTPSLSRLHGMPEATGWGMALARDLAAYRDGTLPWSSVDAGCLLSGPPGVGKSLFARALAASCEVPLFAGSYATWHSAGTGHQGDFLRAMRRTFANAKAAAPAILFIDEVDSFPDRTKLTSSHRSYETQVVNSLLAEIDGADARDGVVVVAACNHPDRLDPALTRSGRLDRHIRLSLPGADDLAAILREHLGADLPGEDLGRAGFLAVGRSGADCEKLVRGARRRARVRSAPMVAADLLAELTGRGLDAVAERLVATHEAGHVVAAIELGSGFVVEAVTIQPNGSHGGAMTGSWSVPLMSEAHVRDRLVVLLAGRAAEKVFLGEVSSASGGGASCDLAQATGIAVRASTSLGMDSDDGLLWLGEPEDRMVPAMLAADPELAARIRARLRGAHEQAAELVRHRHAAVTALADALVARRALSGAEARDIVRLHPVSERRA